MSKSVQERLAVLRGRTPTEAARIVYRRFVFRSITMSRYGAYAGDCHHPARSDDLQVVFWGPEEYDRSLGTSPYLTKADMVRFRQQRSTCIAVIDGDRVAASSWMTGGHVFCHEFQRRLHVPDDEHFSCRSYVDPDYRGRGLLGRMIHAYAATQRPQDVVWGLVLPHNDASVRGLLKIGWRYSGTYSTYYVLGRSYGIDHHVPLEHVGGRG